MLMGFRTLIWRLAGTCVAVVAVTLASAIYLLDIRRRHWVVAAVLFYGLLACSIWATRQLWVVRTQLATVEAQVEVVRRAALEQDAAVQTLKIAYDLSTQSADLYAYIYRKNARRWGYPWEALGAITYVESHFDLMARSGAGACGMMQLLESTAAEQCRKLDIPYKVGSTVWNPALNLYMGAGYFKDCYTNGVADPDARLCEGFKRYLGGSKYRNYPDQQAIAQYSSDVWREYQKLKYIYRGVLQK